MLSLLVLFSEYFYQNPKFYFNQLPYVIQRRFLEVCDAQTISKLKKVNSRVKDLTRRRHVVDTFKIIKETFPYPNYPESLVTQLDAKPWTTIEVLKCLKMDLKKVKVSMNPLIENIVPLYSNLEIDCERIKFAVLKHLLKPNLEYFGFSTHIVFSKNVKIELKYFLDIVIQIPTLKLNFTFRPKNDEDYKAAKDMIKVFAKNLEKLDPQRKITLLLGNDATPPVVN